MKEILDYIVEEIKNFRKDYEIDKIKEIGAKKISDVAYQYYGWILYSEKEIAKNRFNHKEINLDTFLSLIKYKEFIRSRNNGTKGKGV